MIRHDYISTARAKGMSEYVVTTRRMLRNALIPIVTIVGLQFGATLITHRDLNHRSGIVMARLYESLALERAILKKMQERGIIIAQRFTDYVGGFRISCHYFNNRETSTP